MVGKKIFYWSMACLLVLVGIAAAHEGHKHVYRGTVTAVNEQSMTVKTEAGQVITLLLEPATKVVRPGNHETAHTAKDIQTGMRVIVSHQERDGKLYAAEVKLGKVVAKRLGARSRTK